MEKLSKNKRALIGLSVSLAVIVPFTLYSAYLGRSNTTYITSLCADRRCECSDWYRQDAGVYRIENNVWNKGDFNGYQQCVFMGERDGGFEAGWAWNWPGVRFDVVAYPNIMYGKNPWLPATTASLPLRIGDIDCLEAEFEVIQTGTGKGNLAFDLWVTNSASAQPADITREIMIWLSRTGFWSAGSRIDTITFDGKEVGLWVKENHNPSEDYVWTYFAFVYQSDFTEGVVDLAGFLRYLVENGHISADEYLASIQLGNEIVSGYGSTVIRDFEVRVCGLN
jgi:hypothetical protein